MTQTITPYITGCPLGCASPLAISAIVMPEGALRRCPDCGQLVSACSEARYWESMEEFNDPRGTLPDEKSVSRGFRRHSKFLKRITAQLSSQAADIRLLDVGCSSGAFLGSAVKLGFRAEGVEPAPRAAATARARGLTVFQGLLHEARFAESSFDAITLLEVIEHLKDPLSVLVECHRVLRPGGVMLIGTGNAASWSAQSFGRTWEYFKIEKHGGHISFFNPDSLAKLALKAGLERVALHTRSVRFSDRQTDGFAGRQPAYSILKLAGELLNPLATLLGQGEDMAMVFKKAAQKNVPN